MDYEVVWTDPATDDLEEITRYIAQNNPAAAERIANAIVEQAGLLATVPLMGSIFPPGGTGRYRFIVSGKYRIFYRVIEDAKRVEILVVRHHRRQDPDLPEE
jgi:addiction module RelE/StbE family toxin